MTKKLTFYPSGVCSTKYDISVKNDKIESIVIEGGCNGNLSGISKLIEGMDINEVIKTLEGTTCGDKATSCPDQISKALKQMLA